MDDQTKTFGQAAATALTSVAASQGQLTNSQGITDHKRAFLAQFRRWEILFKRKDGANVEAEKWLIAEYYDSLKHLSPEGFAALTKILKEECTFFPSIKECLDRTRPASKYDYSSNVLRGDQYFLAADKPLALAAPLQTLPSPSDHA